ncbi:MAG TPA: EAL domain-containing protein [Solimonas sp.]|nr:EAL domain-containing protein [Solimonas sp.]
MNTQLRILILEDSPVDAKMVQRELHASGLSFTAKCVDTREDFLDALDSFRPELILSDYRVPGFSGLAALQAAQDELPDVPVIIVTGTLGDEATVELLKAGAKDYILKDRPARLGPAVLAALADRQEVLNRKAAEAALRSSEARYRRLFETATDGILILHGDTGAITDANPCLLQMIGCTREELIGRQIGELAAFGPAEEARDAFRQMNERANVQYKNLHLKASDGRLVDIEFTGAAFHVDGARACQCNIRDISPRLRAERALARLKRTHDLLRGINALIVRVSYRKHLFRETCRIAVEKGGFPLAWICLVEGAGEPRLVACYGAGAGSTEDTRFGQGPALRALRDKMPCVVNDVATDPVMSPWREAAMLGGYYAAMSYPLIVGDKVEGTLNMLAAEPDYFDAEEMALLGDIAGDITYAMEFLAHRKQLEDLGSYDQLTKLANRALFSERLNFHVQLARRSHGMLAVLLLDLESLKSVNSTLGMAAVDELLQEVATRLVTFAGSVHFVARVGPELFAAVVPQLKQVSDLSAVLRERVWGQLDRPFQLRGRELRMSARTGVALYPNDGEDAENLLRHAEAALHKAKATGERHSFYTQAISAALQEKLSLESGLRRAQEQGEFVLHYQPKMDLSSGAICGAEALLRWNSPELGLVPPGKFIALLEESWLILEVGRWVLEQAKADRLRWLKAGLSAPRVAVNVSAMQLRQPDFVDVIRAVCAGYAPDEDPCLELEITESVLMSDVEQSIEKFQRIRELGVSIAMDDFGTGYSSLAYLARLPISAVKIDRSFIAGMTASTDTRSIVSTIISLAHSMGLRVIAEGVELQEQLDSLRLLQCDEMQGYLFARPMPADQFAALLEKSPRLPKRRKS